MMDPDFDIKQAISFGLGLQELLTRFPDKQGAVEQLWAAEVEDWDAFFKGLDRDDLSDMVEEGRISSTSLSSRDLDLDEDDLFDPFED